MSLLPGQTLDNTIGAVFLGIVGASILYGATLLQAYLYYIRYPRDSLYHKLSVGLLFALDTVNHAVAIHIGYHFLVAGFGRLSVEIEWSTKLQTLLNICIILITQSLYAHRVWRLGGFHRGVLGYLVAAVVAGGFALGIMFAYEVYTTKTFLDLKNISWAINSALAAATAIDFLIALAMCYYLYKSQGQQPFVNSRIWMIMQFTLSTGLLTSAFSLATLFVYTLLPNTLVFLALNIVDTRLYAGSFLAMMNARQDHRDESSASRSQHTVLSLPRRSLFSSPTSPPEPIDTFSDGSTFARKWDVEASPTSPHVGYNSFRAPDVKSTEEIRMEYMKN